jgi:hypothetical protein
MFETFLLLPILLSIPMCRTLSIIKEEENKFLDVIVER